MTGGDNSGDGDDRLAEHIVAALAPCQYEGLISRHTVDAICRSDCGALPAAITSLFGFECQLGQEKPAADFLVRIGAEPGEWSALDVAGRDDAVWRGVATLLRTRARPRSPLAALLKNIWLEYDFIDPADPATTLNVFFGTDKIARGADTKWAMDLAAMLRGERLSAACRQVMKRLVAALPQAARVFQIGVMCARPRTPLRVCVIGPELDEVCSFLSAARWSGALPRVVDTLNHFAPVIDHVALDLDILDDGRIGTKLGIELYQAPGADIGPQFVELISRLAAGKFCVPQKATGLLAWGGITHERRHRNLWPAALMVRRALRGGGESSTFCRWLHHIKIVIDGHAPPAAKAYLAVGHVFLADSAIRDLLRRTTEETGAHQLVRHMQS